MVELLASSGYLGSRAPDRKVAARRHGTTGDADLSLFLDLPGACPSLQLLDGVAVVLTLAVSHNTSA